MDYRDRLKELREEKGLKQQDIAEICKVSDATVGHWENHRRDTSIDCLITLARFYKVSLDYILGLSDKRKP